MGQMTNICLVVYGYDIDQPKLVILTNLFHSVSQIIKQYENEKVILVMIICSQFVILTNISLRLVKK